MEIRVLGCSGGSVIGFNLTTLCINNRLLVDAGSASFTLSVEEQTLIDTILLTHSHLDHVLSIPFIAENIAGKRKVPIEIVSPVKVLDSVKEHILNDSIWPDFTQIPHTLDPVLKLIAIDVDREYEFSGLKIRAIKVSHAVPTYGYIIKDDNSGIVFTGDTAPTQKIWDEVNKEKNIKAIITEVSYPDCALKVASISRHMTSTQFGEELKKINDSSIPIFIYHMKPQHIDKIKKEIRSLNNLNVHYLEQGRSYLF